MSVSIKARMSDPGRRQGADGGVSFERVAGYARDQGVGVIGRRIAAPGDVVVRADQHQAALIALERFGLRLRDHVDRR